MESEGGRESEGERMRKGGRVRKLGRVRFAVVYLSGLDGVVITVLVVNVVDGLVECTTMSSGSAISGAA